MAGVLVRACEPLAGRVLRGAPVRVPAQGPPGGCRFTPLGIGCLVDVGFCSLVASVSTIVGLRGPHAIPD